MHITYLSDHPQYIPTLAAWHQAFWGHLSQGSSTERRVQRLRGHTGQQIPTTVIALDDDTLLGSASIVANDLTVRPELTPFLASVYVAPEHRDRGAGSLVVQRIMEEAAALGMAQLYLITPDKQHFYARLGWERVEDLHYRGEDVTLMVVRFRNSQETVRKDE